MSTTVTTDVFCDGPDCVAWISGVTGNRQDATGARAQARSFGWRRKITDGRWLDLCPECSEAPDGEV